MCIRDSALVTELSGQGLKVALLDLGAKRNIARSLAERGCEVTVYPAGTPAQEIIDDNPDGIMLSNGPVSYTHLDVYKRQVRRTYWT